MAIELILALAVPATVAAIVIYRASGSCHSQNPDKPAEKQNKK